MLHAGGRSLVCSAGVKGFWRCGDGGTIVVMCDECDSIWLDPSKTDANDALFAGETTALGEE